MARAFLYITSILNHLILFGIDFLRYEPMPDRLVHHNLRLFTWSINLMITETSVCLCLGGNVKNCWSYHLHIWYVYWSGPKDVHCQIWCNSDTFMFIIDKQGTSSLYQWHRWSRQQHIHDNGTIARSSSSAYWVELLHTCISSWTALFAAVVVQPQGFMDWIQEQVFTRRSSITAGHLQLLKESRSQQNHGPNKQPIQNRHVYIGHCTNDI